MRHEVDYTFTEIRVDIVNGPAPDRLIDPALFRGAESLAKLPQQAALAIEKAKKEGRMMDPHQRLPSKGSLEGDQQGATDAPGGIVGCKCHDERYLLSAWRRA